MSEIEKRKSGRPVKASVSDGVWFRIVKGVYEDNSGFAHQIEIVDVKDGVVARRRLSENRGFIMLEPILTKVMKNQYVKGKILDSRFKDVPTQGESK